MKITLKVKLQEYAKVSHEQYTKGMIGRNELEKRQVSTIIGDYLT